MHLSIRSPWRWWSLVVSKWKHQVPSSTISKCWILSQESKTKQLDQQILSVENDSFRYYVDYSVLPHGSAALHWTLLLLLCIKSSLTSRTKLVLRKSIQLFWLTANLHRFVIYLHSQGAKSLSKDHWGVNAVDDRTIFKNVRLVMLLRLVLTAIKLLTWSKIWSRHSPTLTSLVFVWSVVVTLLTSNDWVSWEDRYRVNKQWRKEKSVVSRKLVWCIRYFVPSTIVNLMTSLQLRLRSQCF